MFDVNKNFVWMIHYSEDDGDIPTLYSSKVKVLNAFENEIKRAEKTGYTVDVSKDGMTASWLAYDVETSISVRKVFIR